MRYPYLIIDDNDNSIQETLSGVERFTDFYCVGTAANESDAVGKILDLQPSVVFLSLSSTVKNSLSLSIIIALYQYLDVLPRFVILADTQKFAFDAVKAGAFDYLLKPLNSAEIIKCIFRIRKACIPPAEICDDVPVPEKIEEHSITITGDSTDAKICIKSYGDYQFVSLSEVVYLKADNNTTDFFLESGRKLTAYKTLKYYENNLPAYFYRIHNSHIINSNFVTRISTGKSLCYLNGNDISVSFSKTFKENVDAIIRHISPDYL